MTEFEPRRDDFSSRYPEIGEIKEGSKFEVNQAKMFYWLMSEKLASLDSKNASFYEQLFIDSVVTSGSSCLQRWVEDYGLNIPQDTIAQDAIKRARRSLVEIVLIDKQEKVYAIAPYDEMKNNPILLSAAINNVTHTYRSIRSTPEIYRPCIKYSQALMTLKDRMVEYNEGLIVDEYIENRIREITQVFMATEAD